MRKLLPYLLIGALLLTSCSPASLPPLAAAPEQAAADAVPGPGAPPADPAHNAGPETAWFPERPRYNPGELVDYTAQTGDTLPGLAHRFNTTVAEILEFNDFIPVTATTMPPGMPMKTPIY
ncbi:MAG: LysM peptidoglycan-binding domain-containing protein, partial [Chloroflexota bacterium]